MSRAIQAFAVFDVRGRLVTARRREDEALEAARVIGGSNWQIDGYTVDPVEIKRTNPNHHHPDMME